MAGEAAGVAAAGAAGVTATEGEAAGVAAAVKKGAYLPGVVGGGRDNTTIYLSKDTAEL